MASEVSRLLDEIADLLEAERRQIRTAEFSGLGRIAARKTDLVARLEAIGGPLPARRMARIGAASRDNLRFLDAALMGLKAAQARIDAIRGAARGLSLYDDRGRALSIAPAGGDVERRA